MPWNGKTVKEQVFKKVAPIERLRGEKQSELDEVQRTSSFLDEMGIKNGTQKADEAK